jgi:hypothetical protein
MAQDKDKLVIIETAAHQILSPVGFKKQKSTWRREFPEVLQQFSLVKKPVGPSWYGPEWGLNLFFISENPKPLSHQLHVQWLFEHFVRPRRKMLAISSALKLWSEVTDSERIKLLGELLRKYVLPCFELYQTQDAVRKMMSNSKAPNRAQLFSGCPDDWQKNDV